MQVQSGLPSRAIILVTIQSAPSLTFSVLFSFMGKSGLSTSTKMEVTLSSESKGNLVVMESISSTGNTLASIRSLLRIHFSMRIGTTYRPQTEAIEVRQTTSTISTVFQSSFPLMQSFWYGESSGSLLSNSRIFRCRERTTSLIQLASNSLRIIEL